LVEELDGVGASLHPSIPASEMRLKQYFLWFKTNPSREQVTSRPKKIFEKIKNFNMKSKMKMNFYNIDFSNAITSENHIIDINQ